MPYNDHYENKNTNFKVLPIIMCKTSRKNLKCDCDLHSESSFNFLFEGAVVHDHITILLHSRLPDTHSYAQVSIYVEQ